MRSFAALMQLQLFGVYIPSIPRLFLLIDDLSSGETPYISFIAIAPVFRL